MLKKIISINASAAVMLFSISAVNAGVYIKFEGLDGPGGDDIGPDNSGEWLAADSFSFGVERKNKKRGKKGGTEDLNIGIGELHEIVIGKGKDASTSILAKAALTGRGLGSVEVCVTDDDNRTGLQACSLHLIIDRAYVKSWKTSAEADNPPTEEVTFNYSNIAFSYADNTQDAIHWDSERKSPWPEGASSLFNHQEK